MFHIVEERGPLRVAQFDGFFHHGLLEFDFLGSGWMFHNNQVDIVRLDLYTFSLFARKICWSARGAATLGV